MPNWAACAGSRHAATERRQYGGREEGRCAMCRRWVAIDQGIGGRRPSAAGVVARHGRTVPVSQSELLQLLRQAYQHNAWSRAGLAAPTDPDQAGGTYEFTEADWSRRVREILDISYEPTGL